MVVFRRRFKKKITLEQWMFYCVWCLCNHTHLSTYTDTKTTKKRRKKKKKRKERRKKKNRKDYLFHFKLLFVNNCLFLIILFNFFSIWLSDTVHVTWIPFSLYHLHQSMKMFKCNVFLPAEIFLDSWQSQQMWYHLSRKMLPQSRKVISVNNCSSLDKIMHEQLTQLTFVFTVIIFVTTGIAQLPFLFHRMNNVRSP